jgi:hypothetical protein
LRRPVGLLPCAFAVLFTASCWQYAARPTPLSEAARHPDDTVSVAGGLNGGTGMLFSQYSVVTWEHGAFAKSRCDRFAAGEGVCILEGGRDRLKGIFILGLGLARMTDSSWHLNDRFRGNPAGISRTAFPFLLSSGCKIAVGNEAALRLTLGWDFCFFVPDSTVKNPLVPLPSADVFYLQDIGPRWTAGAGIGLRGLQLNAVHHLPLGRGLGGNIAANVLYYGWPIRWSAREPMIEVPVAAMMGITVGRNQ